MKRLAMVCMVLIMAACSADKSKELFETAQFEEKQHNRDHARRLYVEIITKYPKSPLAKQAQERLDALGGRP